MNFLETIEKIEPKESLPLLQQRFEKNREFFKKSLPHLAELLNENTKEYHLYIDSRGINIATNDGKILYPAEDGRSTIFKISKRLSENLSANPICKKVFNQKGVVRYDEPTIPVTTKLVNGIIDSLKDEKTFDNKSIYLGENGILPTTSIFGLMSGLQLEYMMRDYSYIHALFVYEPNTDFFIISNYFVDYEECYKKVGPDSFYLFVKGHLNLHVVKKFYASKLVTNNYLRFEVSTYEDRRIEDAKASFLNIQRQNTRGWGSFDDELVGLKNRIKNVDPKNPAYPVFSKSLALEYPICVVGNGPSLNSLLPFIKENEENMIIFSSGTALKPLKSYGIEPDFQIEIERRDHVAGVLKEAPLGETTLLAADIVDPSTLKTAKKSLLFIRAASTSATMNSPKKYIEFANPVVGNASVALALEISKNVLLCGLDVGFKGDGKQHASGSFYDRLNDESKEKIPTRGNFSNDIYTNSLFSLSREMFEHAIAAKKDAKVHNLSDGAYINGAIPKRAEDLKLKKLDKKKALIKIEKAFEQKEVFKETDKEYGSILNDYLDDFFSVLKRDPVRTRKELFEAIDKAYYATTIQNKNENVTGILMSGTLWHILNALFTSFMHIHDDDISALFLRVAEMTEKSVKEEIANQDIFGSKA